MDHTDLLNKTSEHVSQYMSNHPNPCMIYHSLDHTISVVKAAEEIADHYNLQPEDRLPLLLAAWFHDLGYYDSPKAHEQAGADKAEAFLKRNGADAQIISLVKNYIIATKMPQQPTNAIEEMICDADLYHLGTDNFKKNNELMWHEVSAINNTKIDWKQWQQDTVRLMQLHHYHTNYCKNKLNAGKQKNLDLLISEISNSTK